jgi:ubiquitin C-terminal hydrolase
VEVFSKFVKKYYDLEQQDSHECLMYALNLLHEGLAYEIEVDINGEVKTETDALMKKSLETWKTHYEKKYSFIIECFNGMTYNNISCENCEFKQDVFEPYNNISINLPNEQSTLLQCMEKYFSSSSVSTWICEKCQKQGCQKSCVLWSLPNYLIIHLKRFTNDGQKLHTKIDFTLDDLNLTPFVCTDKKDPNNYIYTLYAINYHSGSVNSGHYWSACKNLDNNWYLFNDGNTSKYHNTNDLVTKDAYILFYYRKFINSA